MKATPLPQLSGTRRTAGPTLACALALALAFALSAACAGSSAPGSQAMPSGAVALPMPLTPQLAAAPNPDPRVGLAPGWFDAGTASWNMTLVSTTPPAAVFQNPADNAESRIKSSDLAFFGNRLYQGNYFGWQAWDISNPRSPRVVQAFVCPGSQSDVSVHGNLLFVSHEATSGRVDCGVEPVAETVSLARARGVRIIDVSDIDNPRQLTMVQTCRGSHTHTLVRDPNDSQNVYIYVSGSAGVRSPEELPGCSSGTIEENPNTAQFRIEVIQVPLANPAEARIVSSPRIFNDLTAPPTRGAEGGGGAAGPRPGPTQCHDITVYPEIGLGAGACGGYGLLLDITDVRNPRRLLAVADSNMSFWHSATFNNDGTKLLFSDEWGGGTQPRCRETDRMEWGADAIFTIDANRQMRQHAYYKLPAPQTEFENCVAHNGSLVPIPGRDVMVQAWYQGGISVFDWTDPDAPKEIAFFDRGPQNPDRLVASGHWSAYWYNGYIYGSEEFRGLDVLELQPSPFLSQNEIDAAKTVRFEQFNPQEQPRLVWPPSFPLVRAYLDQLARGNGIARPRAEELAREIARIQTMPERLRVPALTELAAELEAEAARSADPARVRMMAAAARELAGAQ
jgi:hypothetical protein